jgi:hypothetical protein
MTELQDFLIRKAVNDLISKRVTLKLYYSIVDGILCHDINLGVIWENYDKYMSEYQKGADNNG